MAGTGRNYALPSVPLLKQRVRILQAMRDDPYAEQAYSMNSMAYVAYPDHTFNSPQGAAFAVCKTVAAMTREALLFMSTHGYSITDMGRAWLAHHLKTHIDEVTS